MIIFLLYLLGMCLTFIGTFTCCYSWYKEERNMLPTVKSIYSKLSLGESYVIVMTIIFFPLALTFIILYFTMIIVCKLMIWIIDKILNKI